MEHKFKTSSYCHETGCVEVAQDVETQDVLLRGGTVEEDGTRRYTAEEWSTFIGGAMLGEFDYDLDIPTGTGGN